MGTKAKVAPPPNYAPIAQASEASSQYAYQLGREQLDWAREAYAQDAARQDRSEETVNKLIDDAVHRQDNADSMAAQDRQRYEQVFQPLEDKLVKDAAGYTDERNRARADAAAGRASAEVSTQAELARAAAQDRLESYGIDPSQTRSGALDLGMRLQEAAARAGAANMTRDQVQNAEEAKGRALQSEALNIGRGYPGQVATDYGLAMQAGQGAAQTSVGNVNTGLATTASGAQTMGTPMAWQGLGNQATAQWGNTLHQGYSDYLDAYKARAGASSGMGTALGAGLGLLATPLKGSALGSLGAMFEGGGSVTEDMSPSRGVAIDDVPAQINGGRQARLNAGEFIVPEDVVRWKGEEFFQKTIQKSREARPQAPARPRVEAIPLDPRQEFAARAAAAHERSPALPPGAGPSRTALPVATLGIRGSTGGVVPDFRRRRALPV